MEKKPPPDPRNYKTIDEYTEALLDYQKKSDLPEVQIVNPLTPKDYVDVFDLLPTHIQKDHDLLKGFCLWYLKQRNRENIKTRIKVQKIVKRLQKQYPDWKAPQFANDPEVLEAGGKHHSQLQRERWIRAAIKIKKGAPRKPE